MPIYDDFAKLMDLLNRDTEAMRKYRHDLLGSILKLHYPEIYNEISSAQKRNLAWSIWKQLDIRDRARMIAFDAIDNMAQILERHYKMSQEREAKYKSELASKSKKK